MKSTQFQVVMLAVCLFSAGTMWAQASVSVSQGASVPAPSIAATEVPRLIKFSGTLDEQGQALKGPVGVTFALYAQQTGGAALWLETQNIKPDASGNYTVLLGANTASGVPAELFVSGEARWLGIQVGEEPEHERILLVSVPYALKAGDAETLGGLPASAFVTTGLANAANASSSAAATSSATGKTQPTVGAKTSATPQAVTPCSSVTSDGAAAVSSLGLFTTPCNIESSVITQSSGNVGIGTAAPAVAVDVLGNNAGLRLNGTGTHQVTVTSTTTGVSGRLGQDANGFFFASDTNGSNVRFLTNNGTLNEWMRVTSAGKVGIGTIAPQSLFTVMGSQPPAVTSGSGSNAASPVVAITGGKGGNTSAAFPAKGGKGADIIIRGGDGGLNAGSSLCTDANTLGCGPGGSITLQPGLGGVPNTQDLDNSGAVLLAPAGGFVGIGTSAGAAQLYRLEVIDPTNFGLRVQTNISGGTVASFGGNGDFQIDAPGVVGGRFIVKDNGQGGPIQVGIGTATPGETLDVVGNVRTTSCYLVNSTVVSGTCASDVRLKTNIQPFSSVLDRLARLRPVHFDWRVAEYPERHFGAARSSGLIAQEVEEIFPELVSVDAQGFKQVNYTELPYLMLQAVRELKAENGELRSQVEQLRAREGETTVLARQVEELRAAVAQMAAAEQRMERAAGDPSTSAE